MKRGQVTLFIILGIIIFAAIAIYMYARQTVLMPITTENLNNELDNIEEHILECVSDGTVNFPGMHNLIVKIGLQGGYLNPTAGTFRLYDNNKISYLCFSIHDGTCYNRMLTLENMQDQLSEELKKALNSCLDVQSFSRIKPYDVIISQQPEINTQIREDNVLVTVNYPITLRGRRTATQVSRQSFSKTFSYPLGKLYDASQDILDFETQYGSFDILTYMLAKEGKIKIYPKKPYPDKIYTLKDSDTSYVFQFAVQGEAS